MSVPDSDMRNWQKRDFVDRYLEEADVRIVDRVRMRDILKLFYSHFLGNAQNNSVLDFGCGDGILTHELMKIDESLSATLIDGSPDMLNKAKERLAGYKKASFILAAFQDLLRGKIELANFNLAVSSFAIHHLTSASKKELFKYIYMHLRTPGFFVNIDLVIPSSGILEKWYVDLWRNWMIRRQDELNLNSDYRWVIDSCLEDEHYRNIDTLNDQLKNLTNAGFKDVDCFYKHGLFAMCGGARK